MNKKYYKSKPLVLFYIYELFDKNNKNTRDAMIYARNYHHSLRTVKKEYPGFLNYRLKNSNDEKLLSL